MIIQIDTASLKTTRPHEYAIRFLFGGLITAATGLIAKQYGPIVAGLFLAFPAIFPATATLIAKHEKQFKQKAGFDGTRRGRAAAAIDAAGTATGTLGLILFAFIIWHFLPAHNSAATLAVAAFAWLILSIFLWLLRKRVHRRR